MPRYAMLAAFFLAMGLGPAPTSAGEGGGIQWERGVDTALDRAAAEGRPLLLALNALETESANQRLATSLYPSAAWGTATEDWVCLPCNGNVHGGEVCARYGRIDCETHVAALRLLYRLRRLSPDQAVISPAHAVVDPDGRLVWDKEYFTGVVGPPLFERMLVSIAPAVALDRAARIRSSEIVALEETPPADLRSAASAWLERGDPLASAGIVVAADQELDENRRLALLAALKGASEQSNGLIQMGAYEAALFPSQDLAICLAWLDAAVAQDPAVAFGHACRAMFRTEDEAQRRQIRARVGPARPPGRDERAAERELGWLLGQKDSGAKAVPAQGDWPRRQARARRLGLRTGRVYPALKTVPDDAPPGTLRGALLEATPAEIRINEPSVRRAFRERREERVRIAAALALLSAGLDEAGRVPPTILAAVFDEVEGADTRREAVRRLGGEDPGWDGDVWLEALKKAVGGAR